MRLLCGFAKVVKENVAVTAPLSAHATDFKLTSLTPAQFTRITFVAHGRTGEKILMNPRNAIPNTSEMPSARGGGSADKIGSVKGKKREESNG